MTDGVLIGKLTALDLQKIAEYFRLHGLLEQPARRTTELSGQQPIFVKNDYAGTIPPYACLQVTDTIEDGNYNYLQVDQPADADGTAGWYVFNGPRAIEENGFGVAYDGPLCRMLTDGSTVTAGELWGPVANQFTIAPGGSLFVAAGEDNIATDVMRGFFKGGGGSGASLYAARMTEAWSARQATCEIYTLDGPNEPVYVDNQEVYDPLSIFAALSTGDWMKVGLNPDGKYYVVAANCPDTSPLIADPPATQPS